MNVVGRGVNDDIIDVDDDVGNSVNHSFNETLE